MRTDDSGRLSTPQKVAWVIVYVGVGVLVLALTWAISAIRTTQLEGTPTGKALLASSERVLDCTDGGDPETGRPAGECFTDSQERTAKAVGSITDNSLRVSAAIAYCQSQGVHGYKPLLRCAVRLVSTRDPQP